MRGISKLIGGLLLIVGIVWAGQGANLIGGSFMTGQTTWLIVGALVAVVGALMLVLPKRGGS